MQHLESTHTMGSQQAWKRIDEKNRKEKLIRMEARHALGENKQKRVFHFTYMMKMHIPRLHTSAGNPSRSFSSHTSGAMYVSFPRLIRDVPIDDTRTLIPISMIRHSSSSESTMFSRLRSLHGKNTNWSKLFRRLEESGHAMLSVLFFLHVGNPS